MHVTRRVFEVNGMVDLFEKHSSGSPSQTKKQQNYERNQ